MKLKIGDDFHTITIDDYGIGIDSKSYLVEGEYSRRVKSRNCFKTEKQAERKLKQILKILEGK